MQTEHNAMGFVAGTKVHTARGLVPIEQLTLTDEVLSKPKRKGLPAVYVPVLAIEQVQGLPIKAMVVSTYESKQYDIIVCAAEQRFKLEGKGWQIAENIQVNDCFVSCFDTDPELAKGQPHDPADLSFVLESKALYQTEHPDLAWLELSWANLEGIELSLADDRITFEEGVFTDIEQHRDLLCELFPPEDGPMFSPFTRTLYQIKVGPQQNFCISKQGLWVHDATH